MSGEKEHVTINTDDLTEVLRRLEAHGERITVPRRVVIEGLMRQRVAVSPRELHALLRPEYPRLGVATAYRTLETLEEVQAATRFDQPTHEGKYVFCSPRHHHHVVCTRCGLVEELAGCVLTPVERELRRRTTFQINEHALTFYGFCAGCRS